MRALIAISLIAGCSTSEEPEGCPPEPPSAGSPCTHVPATSVASCVYGGDPRPSCRTQALCTSDGIWQVTSPRCVEPLPAACPEPSPTPATPCDDATLACWYADGSRCWCSECRGGSQYPICQMIDPPEWACASPQAGCPTVIPNAGEPCTEEGLSCGPDCELEVVCEDRVWVWRMGQCPICASPDTPVATPSGERPIASLRPGDLVYSVEDDAVVVVPILRVGSTPVTEHTVIRVTLESGRALEMSAGHPTVDGTPLSALSVGGSIDGVHRVAALEVIPFEHPRTHDILPASSSGAYFAAEALVGSTL